jgi:cytoskeletal protein RodZ
MNFSRNKIRADEELASEKLQAARKAKNLQIENISEKIGISQEYLKIIEAGEYNRLPGGVYQRTFIKKYALFLGLDAKKIEDLYFHETGLREKSSENVFSRKKIKKSSLLVFPKILRTLFAIILALVIFL